MYQQLLWLYKITEEINVYSKHHNLEYSRKVMGIKSIST